MSKFSKCYLIGAGASYGHTDGLPSADLPPTGEYLFVNSWKKGILHREEFEPLLEKLVSYLDDRGQIVDLEPEELKYDAELLLKELQEEMDESFGNLTKLGNIDTRPQTALSLCYYLFYELFRQYTKSFSPNDSYYTDLANHFEDEQFGVVSLNYDILFEKAIRNSGQEFYYPYQNNTSAIPISKIHGSINILNDFESGININSDNFIQKVRHTHSNSVHSNIKTLDIETVEKLDFRDLVFGSDTAYEPAIIPPLAKYKDYEKVEIYSDMWKFAEDLFQQASELIIIGSSLTTRDDQLLTLLEENLSEDIEITVVCGEQSKSVKAQLDMRLSNPSFNLDYQYFSDYAESL